jgi:hypothetical protein
VDDLIKPKRYEGRPFLRLVDSYILDAIGQLTDDQRDSLRRMEPKLQATFNLAGTWQQIVEAQLDILPSVPERIREFWAGYLEHERKLGHSVHPNEFAALFVLQNFPSITGDAH